MQIFLIFAFLVIFASSKLDSSLLRIIDQKNNNYIVRGNLPILHGEFRFDLLEKSLKQLTNTKNERIIVISLMNSLTPKESTNRKIESRYFQGKKKINGTNIKYLNYIVLGSFINPAKVPEFMRNMIIDYDQYVSFDKIDTLLRKLRKYLNSKTPTLVYVHCSAGIDRTGYVSGAYKMKYMGASLKDVMRQNLKIMEKKRKHMHFNTYQGLQWYCLGLGRSQKECLIGKKQPKLKNLLKQL